MTVKTVVAGVEYEQTFKKAPERILPVWNANVELLCYFGLEDKIVSAYADNTYNTLFPKLQGKYDSVPKMSTKTFSIEKVRSLNVDLILGWSSTFTDSYLGKIATWNEYGTNCFTTNRPASNVDDYLNIITTIGKIFNKNELAQQKVKEFTSVYDAVQVKTGTLEADKKVKALMIEPGYEGACYVYGTKFLSGDLITKAGGENLFKGGMEKLTFEKIREYNPDVIILMSGSGSNPLALKDTLDMFNAIPGFASMTQKRVPFGFYEIYCGGLLPDDILDRLFRTLYPPS